jgi:hypothetical protein
MLDTYQNRQESTWLTLVDSGARKVLRCNLPLSRSLSVQCKYHRAPGGRPTPESPEWVFWTTACDTVQWLGSPGRLEPLVDWLTTLVGSAQLP